jgi:hypothetical protein
MTHSSPGSVGAGKSRRLSPPNELNRHPGQSGASSLHATHPAGLMSKTNAFIGR